ncbi:MAG TPA: hydantoinase/oxoprolinase family protein [Candidatus Baltobacteraceae bacterium]|nr:hydantoinase/oxoprolinase family protein [Candidatus Baltobacteraceae bacterium]
MRKLRLGIDVGGTFTDVVAIDAQTRTLTASVKVPTTHDAPEGVAAGIAQGIRALFERSDLSDARVVFIAHSTTQATNALLEGDVATTGVLGLTGMLGAIPRAQMRFPQLELAPGVPFACRFAFARENDPAAIAGALETLLNAGVNSVAVSAPFGVDRPDKEDDAADAARSRGALATSGHDVSSMYGLRARTRTAALNAAILPKMVSTAQMTQSSVQAAAIQAPLMIMRSDGGVMDVREMERRPILTLLSGPAAGVAGALLHENVTDGIFIEVGGTSSDCSAIRAGMPQMRPARVGGHRTMLRTLDVRTLAIAGGSMPRIAAGGLIDVGPRSAHIAGCSYAAFTDRDELRGANVQTVQPTPHDPADYAILVCPNGRRVSVTPTCAANMLGTIPEGAFAQGDAVAARRAFEVLATHLNADADVLAKQLLDMAARKVVDAIDELVADYALDRETLVVVGGGGGAAAIVPAAATASGLEFRIARNAEVISPVGVALALVRESVERTIVNPTPDDILRLRRQAQDAVIAAGAAPENVQVAIEIDSQRNIVRAIASGAAEISETSAQTEQTPEQLLASAARLMRCDPAAVRETAGTGLLTVFECEKEKRRDLRVLDRTGVGRLSLRDAAVRSTTAGNALADLADTIEKETSFGDVGRALPEIYVVHGARIADFSGLASADQAQALAQEELSGRDPADPVVFLTSRRMA